MDGKVVVVTGASGALGRVVVEAALADAISIVDSAELPRVLGRAEQLLQRELEHIGADV